MSHTFININKEVDEAIIAKKNIEDYRVKKNPSYERKNLGDFFGTIDFNKIIYCTSNKNKNNPDQYVPFGTVNTDDTKYTFVSATGDFDGPDYDDARKMISLYIEDKISLVEVPATGILEKGFPPSYFIKNNQFMVPEGTTW